MKKYCLIMVVLLGSWLRSEAGQPTLPYATAGWTDQEAAAHLLNRFAYGPQLGQVAGVAQDPHAWVLAQIQAECSDDSLERVIQKKYPAQTMRLEEISQTYPAPGVRLILAFGQQSSDGRTKGHRRREGKRGVGQDAIRQNGQNALFQRIINAEVRTDERYRRFQQVAEQRFGWRDFTDLFYQLMSQKLERAVYSPNQLEEIMVDFWFNHFNVSIHGVNDQASQVYSYERDAIRPHALGNFRNLLGAIARHPALLRYLDNHRSNAGEDRAVLTKPNPQWVASYEQQLQDNEVLRQFAQRPGVNENYARELLELHTLGVDGGYTQQDIEEVARAFTGWKASPFIYPAPEGRQQAVRQRITATPHAVLEEGFWFDPTRHDAEAKTILGEDFPAGGGVEEGEKVLDLLTRHPRTAHHIAHKLAARFVADAPPASLVDEMADTFLRTNGDVRAVLTTMVASEAFWNKEYQAAKIKTPLELVVSSLRATDVRVDHYRSLIRWCTQMGQPLYAYQSPTGYPEAATFWTNGTALLNRMNYADALASDKVSGVSVDLRAINRHHEPESAPAVLAMYLNQLVPGRSTQESYELLAPVLSQAQVEEVEARVVADGEAATTLPDGLSQVVGLILGSPEFQRQ